jgi:hypothetical protein
MADVCVKGDRYLGVLTIGISWIAKYKSNFQDMTYITERDLNDNYLMDRRL